jgi:SAM-dependent methyltransferase
MSQASGYISAQQQEQAIADIRQHKLEAAARAVLEAPESSLPPLPLVQTIGSHNYDHFRQNGARFFRDIADRLQIVETSRLLDLGCGCGRMAIPFANFLKQGRLFGCDVWPEGIAWCREHLTADGKASFHLQAAENNYYFNAFDKSRENKFILDWLPDNELDASFAISVFTHLIRNDAQSYLNEIARGTKQGGLAYFTFFLIDKYFWAYRAETGQHTDVKEAENGAYYAYAGQDFFAGFSMGALHEMFDQAGWDVISFDLGSWARKPGALNYQDTFILERRA